MRAILSGNPLGDPHIRDLFVFLPPGYDESSDRFPSVYCLTGFTGRGSLELISERIVQRRDVETQRE